MSGFPSDPMAVPVRPTNTLGVVGFVCSLIGLVLALLTGAGGIISLAGLVISLVALGREPKGMAVAGVILGLLGTCLGVIVILVFGGLILAFLGLAAVFVLSQEEKIEITANMVEITAAVQEYERDHRALPTSLDPLSLDTPTLLDPWGNPYEYLLDNTTKMGFDIISGGEDGAVGTEDDVMLSRLDKAWETAGEDFQRKLKEWETSGGPRIEIDRSRQAEGEAESPEPPQGPPEAPGDPGGP